MDCAEPTLPAIWNAKKVADDKTHQKRIPDEIRIENLEKGLVIYRPDHTVQPVEEILQSELIGHARKIVAENGDVEHRQKTRENDTKTVERTQE